MFHTVGYGQIHYSSSFDAIVPQYAKHSSSDSNTTIIIIKSTSAENNRLQTSVVECNQPSSRLHHLIEGKKKRDDAE